MIPHRIKEKVSPNLSRYITELMKDGRFGVCCRTPFVGELLSGCVVTDESAVGDRFSLTIPYAGINLTWHVIFNHERPDVPPDFIFGPNDDFCPNIEEIDEFETWGKSYRCSLVSIVEQLLELYRAHHLSLVREHSLLQYEYSNILSFTDGYHFTPKDIEVHVSKRNKVYGQTNFLIKLPVDFSLIPNYLFPPDAEDKSAVLLLCLESPEKGVKPQLFLSPSVKQAVGSVDTLNIPPYVNGGAMMDYVPLICDILTNKVQEIATGFEKRKEYCVQLIDMFGSVLEHDAEAYRKMSFLLEWHDFYFIITVDLSAKFPVEKPCFTWQSVYHEGKERRPYLSTDTDYPYSPRWKASEIAERAKTHILDKVSTFQRKSVSEGKLHVN